jgi:hypothetical protein
VLGSLCYRMSPLESLSVLLLRMLHFSLGVMLEWLGLNTENRVEVSLDWLASLEAVGVPRSV